MSFTGFAVVIVRDKYNQPQNVIATHAMQAWNKPSNWDVVDYFGDEREATYMREELIRDLFPAGRA